MSNQLTAIIRREGDRFVALCPEIDVASQGDSIEEARNNLQEAIELFLECASSSEIEQRLCENVVTEIDRRMDDGEKDRG
jgi:predicted RNase H-like HicB family nuclease